MEYKDFINEIGIMYAFESYKGIIGNSYATDAGKILKDVNPMNYSDKPKQQTHRFTKEMALAFMKQQSK